jgi:hypothetical protein
VHFSRIPKFGILARDKRLSSSVVELLLTVFEDSAELQGHALPWSASP